MRMRQTQGPSLKPLQVQKQGRWVQKWRVESYNDIGGKYGDPPKVYVVSVSSEMKWGCSCPHWKFRRVECKHIHEIKARLGAHDGDEGATMRLMAIIIEKLKREGRTDEEITDILSQRQGELFDFEKWEETASA